MASMAAATMSMGGMIVTSHFSPSSRLLSFQPNSLIIPQHKRRTTTTTTTCSISINHKTAVTPAVPLNNNDLLSGSTRTVTTLFAAALLCIKAFVNILPPPDLCLSIAKSSSSLCFATIVRNTRPGTVNTPLTVVAAGLKKWLDIYSGVLLIRVLLSWFPNIPWERQPLSAIRDLCDPYLSLFRNIVPPVFNSLDISPLLAFAVLGSLSGLLNVSV